MKTADLKAELIRVEGKLETKLVQQFKIGNGDEGEIAEIKLEALRNLANNKDVKILGNYDTVFPDIRSLI